MKVMKITQFIVAMLVLLLVNSVQAHQEKSYIFTGVVGKDSAMVEILGHDEVWNIRYFNFSNLKETYVSGSCMNGIFQFEEQGFDAFKINKKNWVLEWKKNRKKVKHKLILMDTTVKKSEIYYKKRLSLLKFKDYVENDHWKVVEEVYSGVTFFRLKKPINDSINTILNQLHSSYALNKIDTEADSFSFQVTHLSKFLSFKIDYGNENEIFNYDLTTCRPLHFEDIVFFNEGKVPTYQSKEWFDYRYKVFPNKLMPYLKVEDTCLEKDEIWQFTTWFLENENLALKPFTPFEIPNCNMSKVFYIPLNQLNNTP